MAPFNDNHKDNDNDNVLFQILLSCYFWLMLTSKLLTSKLTAVFASIRVDPNCSLRSLCREFVSSRCISVYGAFLVWELFIGCYNWGHDKTFGKIRGGMIKSLWQIPYLPYQYFVRKKVNHRKRCNAENEAKSPYKILPL